MHCTGDGRWAHVRPRRRARFPECNSLSDNFKDRVLDTPTQTVVCLRTPASRQHCVMDESLHEEPASASAGSTSPLPAPAAENMSAESAKKVARQDGPPVNSRLAWKPSKAKPQQLPWTQKHSLPPERVPHSEILVASRALDRPSLCRHRVCRHGLTEPTYEADRTQAGRSSLCTSLRRGAHFQVYRYRSKF